jgi:Ca2+-binding RTX toxin-like protein
MATLTSITPLGEMVKNDMFGSNSLYDLNTLQDGTLRDGFIDAMEVTGSKALRFPGGMVEIEFNVLDFSSGDLRDELTTYLDHIRALNQTDPGYTVTIVVPTQSYIAASEYTTFAREIALQYNDVVDGFEVGNEYSLGARNPDGLFSGHPEGYSVRPTEFGLTETVYGQQVERIVQALNSGLVDANQQPEMSGTPFDPDITIQMSDISGAASLFKGTGNHHAADTEILSQVSASTLDIVDGYIGHYYYNKTHIGDEQFNGNWQEVRSFDSRIDTLNQVISELHGAQYANKDIYFTEWNTNIRTAEQLGLKGASVLAEQFEQMIAMGADAAFVWPLQHNTNSAIAGHYSNDTANLSPSGEVFKLMNELMRSDDPANPRFQIANASITGMDSRLEVNTYSALYETVFVISNRSFDIVSDSMELGNVWGNLTGGRAHTVGIDASSSDGLAMGGNDQGTERLGRRDMEHGEYAELAAMPYFDPNNANHVKIVNGTYKTYLTSVDNVLPKFVGATDIEDFWFLAEPDVRASVTTVDNIVDGTDTAHSFTLNPFEVTLIKIEHSSRTEGTNGSELITGGDGADDILGREGNDTLDGGAGNDTLKGGWGDDHIIGGAGDNDLIGSFGNDTFDMSLGTSDVHGGDGIDTVDYSGSDSSILIDLMHSHINLRGALGDEYEDIENVIGTSGADNIRGTQGDNVLTGGANADFIFGRMGDDTLNGGIGDDVLLGGLGADVLDGGANRDRAQYSESATAITADLLNASANTGEAAGDTYVSIEDLAGSRFADRLSGTNGENRLFGREGEDVLVGRGGDDYLNGGAGQDTLAGGAGDDTMRGGTNGDTFIFSDGHDVIEDFALGSDWVAMHTSAFNGYDNATLSEVNGGTLVELSETQSLLFENILLQDFTDYYL